MTRSLLLTVNSILIGTTVFMLLLAFFLSVLRPSEIPISEAEPLPKPMPPFAFQQPSEAYDAIDETFLPLEIIPPSLQVPDLRNRLSYFGPTGRPDLSGGETSLHFGVNETKDQASTTPGEKLYLLYDRKRPKPGYVFSPENKPTSLWITGEPKEKEVQVKVRIEDHNGKVVASPTDHAQFTLKEKPLTRFGSRSNWKIGKFRVDGTLLARQRARWYGQDLFLVQFGGEEYAELAEKQRIDFGKESEKYSIYLAIGDIAVWENDRWKTVEPGPNSLGRPLLHLKKIEDRLISFDLWDEKGKQRVSLNLLKSKEQWSPKRLEKDFEFVSIRTRTQYVFEVKGEREILRPFDWLILLDGEWFKLTSEEEIDAYVEHSLTGPLFIFNGLAETDGEQALTATLFNSSRTDSQTFALSEAQPETTRKQPEEPSPDDIPLPPPFPPLDLQLEDLENLPIE